MAKSRSLFIFIFAFICISGTGLVFYWLGKVDPEKIQALLKLSGIWAPLTYILLYVIATILILPSTALNLTGGALFGIWMGTFWTSLAAILAATISFLFSRTIGREITAKKLAERWQALDAELCQGGLFYMFAIRLIPVMPYGLVNSAAGLTSISFKDYILGTILGTVPSVLPFVMLGSSGLKAIQTGKILPLVGALAIIGILLATSTWYQRRRSLKRINTRKSSR